MSLSLAMVEKETVRALMECDGKSLRLDRALSTETGCCGAYLRSKVLDVLLEGENTNPGVREGKSIVTLRFALLGEGDFAREEALRHRSDLFGILDIGEQGAVEQWEKLEQSISVETFRLNRKIVLEEVSPR